MKIGRATSRRAGSGHSVSFKPTSALKASMARPSAELSDLAVHTDTTSGHQGDAETPCDIQRTEHASKAGDPARTGEVCPSRFAKWIERSAIRRLEDRS